MEQDFRVPGSDERIAFLVDKKMPAKRLAEIMQEAGKERAAGKQILVVKMNKNKKFQKEQLETQGYHEFKEFFAD